MSVKIVQLSSYTSPKVSEQKSQKYVSYGDDNNYFQYLIDRYNGSPTNNAAINGISQLIFGEGLDATDSSKNPDGYAKMKSLFRDDCVQKLCNDLKLMGQCAIQVIYSKDRSQIAQIEHFPVETLRAEKCNEEGDIEAYYYHSDWSKVKPQDDLKRIPAYGFSNEAIEIYYVKPYRTGYYYYSPVDYQGGLQYSELEEEIANYHLNNIMNGLAPSMLINFNNGIPTEEERRIIETKVRDKFSGTSNAGKFILSFNDNETQGASIEPVQLSDAHSQYQFLSDESMRKIMVSHRIVSPMLLGIKDNTGLGNNAEELKTASNLMDNTVVRPFQNLLINCLDTILAYNEISLKLYFKTLQPIEFADLENAMTKEAVEEETGQKLSLSSQIIDGRISYDTKEEAIAVAKTMDCEGYHTHILDGKEWYMPCETHDLKAPCWDGYEMIGFKNKGGKKVPNCVPIEAADQMRSTVLEALEGLGEDEDLSEFVLVDERPANHETDTEMEGIMNFANVIKGSPSKKSKQDTTLFKIRYQYAPLTTSKNSREFCEKMVKAAKLYRVEDLNKKLDMNEGFGKGGSDSYNPFLFKGGVNCKHFWMRKIYMRKNNRKISVNDAKRMINDLDPSQRKDARFEDNDPRVAQIAEEKNNYWRA
jgi:hypothetical protein